MSNASSILLSVDLRARSILLLRSLGYDTTQTACPSNIPYAVWNVASSNPSSNSTSASDLLDGLSILASCEGVSNEVSVCFHEVLLDLLARWLEQIDGIDLLEWERRLTVMAMLPEIRPELWRFVHMC